MKLAIRPYISSPFPKSSLYAFDKGYHTFSGLLPYTYKGAFAKGAYNSCLFSVRALWLLYQQRYNPRRSTYPLRISYNTSLRQFREHYLELKRLIASFCPKFAPYRVLRVKMPCISDTLYRYLYTLFLLRVIRIKDIKWG